MPTYDNFFNFEDENGQTLLDFMNDRNESMGIDKTGKVQISRMKTETLNKVYRKMNLDHQIKEWASSVDHGIWQWIKLIRSINDYKLQQICGTDVALYLVWIKYCYIFFGTISMINIIFLIIYVTGTPLKKYDYHVISNGASVL